MVGRLRERQYQLAAQKHNESFLKYNYYQQTARYFERECGIARHFNSWNFKDLDAKEQLEKARKADRLLVRRNKLRNLLKEEEDTYERELRELKRKKDHVEDTSLEALREKLRLKRTEESLYLPRNCRRYQSYFACPKEPPGSRMNRFKDSHFLRSRVCRDSTNLIQRNDHNFLRRDSTMSSNEIKVAKDLENLETSGETTRHHSAQDSENVAHPNPKFQARYAQKSLVNTNVRNDRPDEEEYMPSTGLNRSSPIMDSPNDHYIPSRHEDIPIKHKNDEDQEEPRPNSAQNSYTITNQSPGPHGLNNSREHIYSQENNDDKHHFTEPSNVHPSQHPDENSNDHENHVLDLDQVDRCSTRGEMEEKESVLTDNRDFESERSLPWLRMIPHDQNLSKQMFLYLHHKELKGKIEDLAKRESHACTKHSWDDALRLRDMRNRLELNREKRLYHMDGLDLEDGVKKLGLESIDKREEELAEREDACTDSTMYSEDAKALWKKWVQEDEKSVIMTARNQREDLMSKLEKDWQRLAIRDKDRITHSFEHDISGAALQDEHKLAAAIAAARLRSPSHNEN